MAGSRLASTAIPGAVPIRRVTVAIAAAVATGIEHFQVRRMSGPPCPPAWLRIFGGNPHPLMF
jgi:hypothetical protein